MLYEEMAYLFFPAVDGKSRGKGYGSRAIETLKAEYPDRTHTAPHTWKCAESSKAGPVAE